MALNLSADLTIGGGKKLTDVELIAGAIRTIPSGSVTASITVERVEDGQIIYVESEDKLYKANKAVDEFFTTTVTWQPFEWPTSLSAGGDISGSGTSTASFGTLEADTVNATSLTGTFQGALSSSAQIASDISGSFFSLSQSLADRLQAEEGEAEGSVISSSLQIASAISGSLGTNATLIRSLTSTGISGSLGTNATLIRSLTAASISGSLGDNAALIRTLTAAGISGSLGDNAALIRTLTAAGISGSLSNNAIAALQANIVSGSSQIASDISGSLGVNADLIRSLTAVGISGSLGVNADLIRSLTSTGISGSLGTNASLIRSLNAIGISGSLGVNADLIRSLTAVGISGSLGTNASLIRSLTAAGISGSLGVNANLIRSLNAVGISGSFKDVSQSFAEDITADSQSVSLRVTSLEGASLKFATTGSNHFSGSQTITGSLIVTDRITAQEFHTEFTSASIVFTSGSTKFGDTPVGPGILGDVHQFTGSVRVTGSVTALNYTGVFNGALSSSAQIASDISGSLSKEHLAAKLPNIVTSSVQIASDISGSLGVNADLIRSLTAAGISGSLSKEHLAVKLPNIVTSSVQIASDISGSLGVNADLIRSLTALGISGSLSKEHLAVKLPNIVTSSVQIAQDVSGSLGVNADLIRSLTALGVSGSFRGLMSASFIKDVGGGVSGSHLSTGSFGRMQASVIGGNSPLVIQSDNFNVNTTGDITANSANFGSANFVTQSVERLVVATGSIGASPSFIVDDFLISASNETTASLPRIEGKSIKIDNIHGDWTNAGNIVADLGTITTADINGGTIDGTTIGINSATKGNFTEVTSSVVSSSTGIFTKLSGSSVNIDGGTIDGTDITVGSSKTLDVSAGTLTLAANQISGDAINGGVIDTTTITTLNATTIKDFNKISGSGTSTASFARLEISDNALITGSLSVLGKITAQEFHTELTSASITFSSGSTKFGDTGDDVHDFTGSLNVTGSTKFGANAANRHDFTGSVNIKGDVTIEDSFSIKGPTITFGDNQNDNIIFTGQVQSDILPDANTTYDLGSDSLKWQNLYVETVNLQAFGPDARTMISGSLSNDAISALQANIVSSSAQIEGLLPANAISSSAQIASDISGSLSNQAISNLNAGILSSSTQIAILDAGIISSSTQIAVDISGSWRGELSSSALTNVGGGVSGSAISTGSFGRLEIAGDITASGTVRANTFESINGGSQIDFKDNIEVSGDITASGNISGSHLSTGSFGAVTVAGFAGDDNLADFSSSLTSRVGSMEAGNISSITPGIGLSDDAGNSSAINSGPVTLQLDFNDSTLQDTISGSFSQAHLSSKIPNIVSGSPQLAVDISGSWKGELSSSNKTLILGGVSSSANATSSFGTIELGKSLHGLSGTTANFSRHGLKFGDKDSGFYEKSDDVIVVRAGNEDWWQFLSVGVTGRFESMDDDGPRLLGAPATETVPTLIPRKSDDDTGIGWESANNLALIAGGNTVITIRNNMLSGSHLSTGSFGAVTVAGFAGDDNLADFSSSISTRVASVSSTGVTDVVGGTGISADRTDSTETVSIDFNDSTLQDTISGSFSAAHLASKIPNIVSGSPQLAVDISGSWRGQLSSSALTNVGGGVSGSATSTGSFGRLEIAGDITASGTIRADAFESINGGTKIDFNDSVDVQGDITASGNLLVVNDITGSGTSTGSFGTVLVGGFADKNIVNFSSSVESRLQVISEGEITAITPGTGLSDDNGNSAQIQSGPVTLQLDFNDSTLQTTISGSFRGELSSSGYLRQVSTAITGANTLVSGGLADRLELAELELLEPLLSSSTQIAADISSSWRGELSSSALTNVGGGISGSFVSTGSLGRIETKMISASRVEGDWLPSSDDIFDLGSSTSKWKDLYLDGTGSIDLLKVNDKIEYNGVTINAKAAEFVATGSNFVFKATNNSNLLSLVDTNGDLSVKFDEKIIVLAPKTTVGDDSDAVAGGLIYSSSNEFYLGFAD